MSTGGIIALVVVLVLVLAAAAWVASRQTRRNRLRRRFGPEYEHRVAETGDRMVAERELMALEQRHARFKLRPLSDAERVRYAEQWTVVQEQFVDRPGEATAAAEELVNAVMRDRGYPDGDFEQRARDLSVEHGPSVGHYREARGIRLNHEAGGVSTEDLRRALKHYRAIFMSLTGIRDDPRVTGEGPIGPHVAHTGPDPNATRADMDAHAGRDGTRMPADRPMADQPRHTGRERHA